MKAESYLATMDYFFNRDASIRAILMILSKRKRVTRKVIKYRFCIMCLISI